MAFSDDIITTIGANLTPLAKALRAKSVTVTDFARDTTSAVNKVGQGYAQETEKALRRQAGNLAKGFGVAGLIAGFKSLISMAREAREEGTEFSKQGWISPETISVLNETEKFFESIVKNVREFAAYVAGSVGRFFRWLGAFTVTGSWSEANKAVKAMAEEDAKALKIAGDKAEAEKRSIELAKKKADLLTKQKELTLEIGEATKQLSDAETRLIKTKEDRSKLSLQELAFAIRPTERNSFMQQQRARQVIALEKEGERQRLFNPQLSMQAFGRADEMRKSLSLVTEAERNPWAGLEDAVTKSEDHLLQLLTVATKLGVLIRPTNGR